MACPELPTARSRWPDIAPGSRGGGKKAAARLAGKRPLTGETGALARTINYRVSGEREVRVGSPMVYAAAHQYGARQGSFGRTRRGGPIPWGTIPARPFLGLSATDQAQIVQLVRSYLAGD
ncbi:MAG: phage virion morphogenesis protein [Comamonadaceae bacterium]|nr:phage virion morphogenesis protein [Comamonadaceae bacterium]